MSIPVSALAREARPGPRAVPAILKNREKKEDERCGESLSWKEAAGPVFQTVLSRTCDLCLSTTWGTGPKSGLWSRICPMPWISCGRTVTRWNAGDRDVRLKRFWRVLRGCAGCWICSSGRELPANSETWSILFTGGDSKDAFLRSAGILSRALGASRRFAVVAPGVC